jgi:3-hydroxyisobutyrate dehydrogenase-like beta-hydroxyacid dehydrogenase
MKIAFIGLGQMGTGMASNLIKAGHNLTVHNRTRSRAEALKPLGAKVADTPAKAAAEAEVVITMLADDRAVEGVLFGPDGVLQSLAPGATHISSSTISVALSRRLIKEHADRKQHYLSVPVFGRPEVAAAGKLFIVAAGAADQLDRHMPLFEVMGQKTFRLGDDPASANVVKLTGNFMISTVIESLAESFSLVRKCGVPAETFLEIMTSSLFGSPIYKNYGAMIASDNFDNVGFALPLGFKDNRLVIAAAEEAGVPLPLASLIHDRFVAAMAQGLADSDWSAIARISYRSAGL